MARASATAGSPKCGMPGKPCATSSMPTRETIATPFHWLVPWLATSYPMAVEPHGGPLVVARLGLLQRQHVDLVALQQRLHPVDPGADGVDVPGGQSHPARVRRRTTVGPGWPGGVGMTHEADRPPPHRADRLRPGGGVLLADGGQPRGVPGEVPQDGRRPVRVLPGHGVPVLRRHDRRAQPVGRRLRRRPQQPDLDPRRPARGELRHLHELRRPAGLRRQRLRRGLHRPLHLGPAALRRQPGAAGLAQGAARGRGPQAGRSLQPRLPRPGQPLPGDRGRRQRLLAVAGQHRRPDPGDAAAGPRAQPRRAARPDDLDRDRGPPVHRVRRPAAALAHRAVEGGEGLRALPRLDPRGEADRPRGVLRRARHRRGDRLRDRQRRAAGVQPARWRATTRRRTTTSCSA